jgi:RNase H-like domain found in reverse transcriptase/Integrase zinc binding domain/Integrase core domain
MLPRKTTGVLSLPRAGWGTKHPVGYWSRGLTSAERNYSTTENECLEIVWAVLQLRPYLEGKYFVIQTDHNYLRWVLNVADAKGLLSRWRLRLLEFDLEVQYATGKKHHGADTLSRLIPSDPSLSEPPTAVNTEIPCFEVSRPTLQSPPTIVEFQIWQHETPTPVLLEDFIALQEKYPACRQLAVPNANDVDRNLDGVIGTVLPDGEFTALLPESLRAHAPITIVEEPPLPTARPPRLRGDTSVLRRGVIAGIRYDFPQRGLADLVTSPEEVLVAPAQVDEVLPLALQLEEIRHEQAADTWCRTLILSRDAYSLFDLNAAGILVRKAPLDKAEQIVVPPSLRHRILHFEHFPRVAGHPGVTRMFRSIRRHYFWEHMASDVANTVNNCTVCAKNRISERKRTSFLKLFPASEPLEYIAVDILGPLPKTEHGNQFLLVITDRFSKLTRTVPLRSISAFMVARYFCEQWVFVNGAPRYVLTDNGTQVTAKSFLAVCRELGIGKEFTTAYHPQTNGPVERFNRTIVNSLRGYVSQYQKNWDGFTSAITFGYNYRIHSSMGLAPFELVLSRPPPPFSTEHP